MKELIRKILKEEKLSKQDVLKKQVLKHGWESVSNMIGFDNLYKIGFNNDYNEFLNLFNNLNLVNIKDEDLQDYLTNDEEIDTLLENALAEDSLSADDTIYEYQDPTNNDGGHL